MYTMMKTHKFHNYQVLNPAPFQNFTKSRRERPIKKQFKTKTLNRMNAIPSQERLHRKDILGHGMKV